MVMDFVNGGELFFHIKKAYRFSEDKARFYTAEIILAIKYLHELGIIYRYLLNYVSSISDLKPENILIDKEGHVKITDFGLSKWLREEEFANTLCGTPEYVAPEILLQKGYNKTVDWFSLVTNL